MADLLPIHYLPQLVSELRPKGGGGGPKEPFLDIDESGLRSSLSAGLSDALEIFDSAPSAVSSTVGLPLKMTLRTEALAKSNRPTEFLTTAGIQPTAVTQPGELIARVRRQELISLQAAIESGISPSDRYAISSFEDLAVYDPIDDGFALAYPVGLEALLETALEEGKRLRLDFFPWLDLESPWGRDSTLERHLFELGLVVRRSRNTSGLTSIYVDVSPATAPSAFIGLYGLRHGQIEPSFSHWQSVEAQSFAIIGAPSAELKEHLDSLTPMSVVGVLDSGIDSDLLSQWVQAREVYDLGADANPEHGTFVAALVLAGSKLNDEPCFTVDAASLIDCQVLPSGSIQELDLIDRISECVRKYPQVGVWNCSFNELTPNPPRTYSVLASALDDLASVLSVLFVQSAGNYGEWPHRAWPPTRALRDGISSPADAVNSLVVGSLSHRGGRSPAGAPASYSRRGPGFGGQAKPDVAFWSGDLGPAGELPHSGVRSLLPGDQLAEGVGTSFSTPLVSAMAANIWAEVSAAPGVQEHPALVKGLIMHGAAINSRSTVGPHRNYFGAGVPRGDLQTIFEGTDSFTTVHDVLLTSKISWLRAPFPIPACLLTPDGKLRAEVFMTVAYNPHLDRSYGDESVRSAVEASFGVIDRSGPKPRIHGRVSEDRHKGKYAWESERIEAGKWSPVQTHYKAFPQGSSGAEWGAKLTLTERDDSPLGIEQRAFLIVTLRAFEDSLPVYLDGVREINHLRLANYPLSVQSSISVDVN